MKHGTDTRYKQGCHCRLCRKAHNVAQRPAQDARDRALVRLSHEYAERFQELLKEEKLAHGVRLKPGRPRKQQEESA